MSEPELPERFTKLDRIILTELREVWQNIKLPKVIDWERDVRGVRYWWCEHSKQCVPEDGLYLCGEDVFGRTISPYKYVANRDERRRENDHVTKAINLSHGAYKMLQFDWYSALHDEMQLKVLSATHFGHTSIEFENDRFYLPRQVGFVTQGAKEYSIRCFKVIKDDDAIRYVRAGRDPADFHPKSFGWTPGRDDASDPVSQSSRLDKDQSSAGKSTRSPKLAKQRGLF